MSEELKLLYRELGYLGPLPETDRMRTTRGIAEDSQKANELPVLGETELKIIEQSFKDDPDDSLALFRNYHHYDLTDDQIRGAIAQARSAFDDPAAYLEKLRGKRGGNRGFGSKGTYYPDELIQFQDITIDPDNHKFEKIRDALGWFINTGQYFFRDKLKLKPQKAAFPLHTEFGSEFKYEMKDIQGKAFDPEQKVRVALFADFGTGLDHSRYIANHIAALKPDYAIHLGDVYYAGRFSEFEHHFTEPIEPIMKSSRLFSMNGNHEMYSGGFPYFSNIDYRRNTRAGWIEQEQEGSYFCIWNTHYQIIGIDTAYYEDGRHRVQHLNDWLGRRLHEGKSASPKRTNILLSPNEPYTLGKDDFTGLYHDLEQFIKAGLIDFWFWGNTHYCTLFDKSDQAPFVGSCIGHAGHPIYKNDVEKNDAKHKEVLQKNKGIPQTLWVDHSTKYPEHTNIRSDLANHGFCVLELGKDTMQLTYYDWQRNEQHSEEFSKL